MWCLMYQYRFFYSFGIINVNVHEDISQIAADFFTFLGFWGFDLWPEKKLSFFP